MTQRHSPAYIQHRQRGPFPGHIDPWAEAARYFQQIHSGMIHNLQDQLQDTLIALGYQAGKEASLQIFASRQPDLYIQDTLPERESGEWDYETAAASLEVEAGTAVLEDQPEIEALHITDMDSGELVTVLEIISPRNKTHPQEMALYREQRTRVFLDADVNVVEIDATRSYARLLAHKLAEQHAYHIAVYLPGELPRMLVCDYGEPLPPFALPLRGEAVRVEPHAAYERAYVRGAIAGLIEQDGRFVLDALPFPAMLSDPQRERAHTAVINWRQTMARITNG